MARRYAILGGGALGLTTALRLLQRGHAVTLFEREPEPGGLAAGFLVNPPAPDGSGHDDVWLDKFYHHIFRSDTAATALIAELGLGDLLEWRRPLTTALRGGRVYQLDSARSVLRFQPISMLSRLRMGAALALLKLLPTAGPLEGKRAVPWIRSMMGAGAYDAVWGPLLKGKFGAVADEIALPWFWARVHDRTAELGYVRGGFQRLYNRLAERIRELGGDLRFGAAIQRIERDGEGIAVTYAPVGGPEAPQRETFDRCVSTLPTRLTCQLTPELPEAYRARYEWGRAYGAHCLILALDRQVTDGYWMNINDPGYPFMVLVEHTNYMPVEDYAGRRLIYLGNYRAMDDPLFRLSKQEVLDQFTPQIARINPAFDASWIQESWMFAAPYAQPIVTTDYREHIPPFDTPLPGLFAANMFQVYPHDRGQNYSIELAERLARHLEGV